MDLLNSIKTVERCQRNFDLTQPVPENHIKFILDAATSMPTRQNRIHYNITVVNDTELTRDIYTNIAFDKDDRDHDLRNGQTYAPLLLIFGTDSEMLNNEKYSYRKYDVPMSVGLASGAAAIAASSLGYVTGFCKCFNEDLLEQWILKTYNKKSIEPRLMLGIGKPNTKFDRTECVIDDEVVYTAGSMGDKDIEIFRK